MRKSKYQLRQEKNLNLAEERKQVLLEEQEQLKLDKTEQTQLVITSEDSDLLVTDKSVYYRSNDYSKNRTFNIKDVINTKVTKSLSKYGIKTILAMLAITIGTLFVTLIALNTYTENRELRNQYYDYVFSTPSASLNDPALRVIDEKDTVLFFVLAACIAVSVITAIISIIKIIITCRREMELYVKIKYKKGSCKIKITDIGIIKEIKDMVLLAQR